VSHSQKNDCIMADKRVLSEIVTEFFLNTCRLCPQLTEHAVQAAARCAEMATDRARDHADAVFIPIVTGSVAEFYIEPVLPLVGDIDIMFHLSTQLAIPRGHSPPTQLPDEFSNCVKVYEIVDSNLPGYVYLELRYVLIECVEGDMYCNVKFDVESYLSNIVFSLSSSGPNSGNWLEIHGPAVAAVFAGRTHCLSVDAVQCIRCLPWPPQVADWPARHRNYNWPDSATVDRVVSNGCDVVPVAHRQCRQHKLMSIVQWRLSFSRAEIVLINSWMPVQQIVYHMLRVFVKTELSAERRGNNSEAISNYHIKTLMMWSCELKSSTFWTNDLNLIRICEHLLHTLSIWLTDARCKHYFISNCNLIDNSAVVKTIATQLAIIQEASLSTWFVDNYIQKCFMLCSTNFSKLFRDVSMELKIRNVVLKIVNWRLNTVGNDRWQSNNVASWIIPYQISYNSLTVRSSICWKTELAKIDTRLTVYFTAIAFLQVAYKMSTVGFTDELMDVLATLTGQLISTRHHSSQCSSQLSLSKATKFMKVVANSSRSTMQLIQIELSKAYLHRALRYKDSDSDSIYCLTNVYLAVLYYTTGQYQTAIDHCTLVMRSQDHSQCSSHVVQGELLPKIDGDIDNILGLTMFYQYVRTAALNQQQTQHVSNFTTKLFAHCLNIKCLSVTQTLSNNEVCRFTNYFCNKQLFIDDVLAVKSVIYNCQYQPSTVQSSQQPTFSLTGTLNTSELIELLQRSAVEHLTTYRHLEARHFGSVVTIVTTDFEALYAYKHGDYQQCLQLCTQNVHTLMYVARMNSVATCAMFIQLLDDDIVSLMALMRIVHPEHHRDNFLIGQLTLSLCLMTQCQLRQCHSVTSLAQIIHYINFTQRRYSTSSSTQRTLDHLTLTLTKRKILMYFWDRSDRLIPSH